MAGGILLRLADNRRTNSLATRLRQQRFAQFRALLEQLPERPVHILDLGGTAVFWRTVGYLDPDRVRVTLLNRTAVPIHDEALRSVAGDATDLRQFSDKSIDVVFSNSVIEHVGDRAAHERMANEIRRVGQRFWVQTPNRYFPIEPHALFPFFQFLPMRLRLFLAGRLRVGWYRHMGRNDVPHIAEEVRNTRLLTMQEMRHLFPEATIERERVLGLTKSFMATYGWPQS